MPPRRPTTGELSPTLTRFHSAPLCPSIIRRSPKYSISFTSTSHQGQLDQHDYSSRPELHGVESAVLLAAPLGTEQASAVWSASAGRPIWHAEVYGEYAWWNIYVRSSSNMYCSALLCLIRLAPCWHAPGWAEAHCCYSWGPLHKEPLVHGSRRDTSHGQHVEQTAGLKKNVNTSAKLATNVKRCQTQFKHKSSLETVTTELADVNSHFLLQLFSSTVPFSRILLTPCGHKEELHLNVKLLIEQGKLNCTTTATGKIIFIFSDVTWI